jgi:hypothetical protein
MKPRPLFAAFTIGSDLIASINYAVDFYWSKYRCKPAAMMLHPARAAEISQPDNRWPAIYPSDDANRNTIYLEVVEKDQPAQLRLF